jgi:hypothetical protein
LRPAAAALIIGAAMRAFLLLWISASVWLPGVSAQASAPLLAWRAPAGCPSEAHVRAAIERALDPAAQDEIRSLRAEVVAVDGGYQLDLQLATRRDVHQKRMFAQLCSTFVDVLTLELSFSAVPKSEKVEPPAPPARLAWGARVSGSVGSGPLPSPSPALSGALFLLTRALRLELAFDYGLPREVRYREPATVGGRFDAFGGQARACYELALRRVALPFCAGAELAALRGRGIGVPDPFSVTRLWAGLFVAPALSFSIVGPLSAWTEVAGVLSLLRPRFGLGNLPLLYQPPQWSVRGALGLAVTFD